MPHFFFDIREGMRLVRDDTGLCLPNLEAAEHEAALAAASIGRDVLPSGDASEVAVAIRTEGGEVAAVVTVTMTRIRRAR